MRHHRCHFPFFGRVGLEWPNRITSKLQIKKEKSCSCCFRMAAESKLTVKNKQTDPGRWVSWPGRVGVEWHMSIYDVIFLKYNVLMYFDIKHGFFKEINRNYYFVESFNQIGFGLFEALLLKKCHLTPNTTMSTIIFISRMWKWRLYH
jgi:hypothetical protein